MGVIVITTSSFGEYDKAPIAILENSGFTVRLNPHKRTLKEKELIEVCKDAVGIIAGVEPLTAAVIEQLKLLKVISRCGAGLENVDMAVAGKLGIKVYNTPDAPTNAVAELAIALILNLLRRVNYVDDAVKHGTWEKVMGSLLSGKKVGIVGFGRIGKRVAELLKPFGCGLSYYDPFVKEGIPGSLRVSLEELIRSSDIISIHAAAGETIFGEKEIRSMKKGAYIINTARGKVIDEAALYRALKDGHIGGAGLDVFSKEPYKGELSELKNVILTPHIGSYAREARVEMERQASENLVKGLGKSI